MFVATRATRTIKLRRSGMSNVGSHMPLLRGLAWCLGALLAIHMPLPMNHVAAGSVSACTSIGSLAQVTGPPVGSVLLTELLPLALAVL